MPANKYALLRYRIIDRCIRNKQRSFPSKEDLRTACEEALYGSESGDRISMSTIDKDIWAMRNEGELGFYAPIAFNKERGGYYYTDPNYTISELPLTQEDLDALSVAAQTLFQFRDIPLFKEFDAAIEKILDRMKISAADGNKVEHDVLQFERSASYQGSQFLAAFFKAAQSDLTLQMTYKKFNSTEEQKLLFDTYLLKEYGGRWYAIGFDHAKQEVRTYSLDRVLQVNLTTSAFKRSKQFDTKKFFKHAIGITVTNETPVEVVLHFSPKLAPYIMSQSIHPTQNLVELNPDGSVMVSLLVIKTIELISLILGYGPEVTVISPMALRLEVKSTLTTCSKKYA